MPSISVPPHDPTAPNCNTTGSRASTQVEGSLPGSAHPLALYSSIYSALQHLSLEKGERTLPVPNEPRYRSDHNATRGKKGKHKTINSWLLVLALGKGRCMAEQEETGTDGGWDLLQEPQGRQCWLRTPETRGCSPTGEGSVRLPGQREQRRLLRQGFF